VWTLFGLLREGKKVTCCNRLHVHSTILPLCATWHSFTRTQGIKVGSTLTVKADTWTHEVSCYTANQILKKVQNTQFWSMRKFVKICRSEGAGLASVVALFVLDELNKVPKLET